ncbi:hypothetical protein L3H50_00595 [Corynebacterium sp. MC-04]|uniref:DUF304 domain-containing protein n=1 Tax=Corynebacterium parakroppenstedtii TaxID=2828363 RepID=A0ABS9HI10_9CORY|nr:MULTISPECIES: hypothetical protein [Corynebacterium]KXB50731.1 hypothetical protein HMPREF1861_00833 [Corynebacterium kroppenstedtii]MBY0792314.1 hypothetical protein [Corynebacterium parakroppenstedtii]MBY0795929.1 hypothetical protein [Corynebacterium parakroppenstedtii]MCF6769264.1 hypothetical protein [Corynebacterium parakroppenstedtii]MCF6770876.1 hypothetical protein [Corynebacterium parakroppenstedtii]
MAIRSHAYRPTDDLDERDGRRGYGGSDLWSQDYGGEPLDDDSLEPLPPFNGGFPEYRIADDERVLVDVHSKRGTLVFPVLETILISGIMWGIIGMIDGAAGPFVDGGFGGLRQFLLIAWVVAMAWFFARPVMKWWRNRLVVTNYRVVARFAKDDIVDIPLDQVTGLHRRRSTLIFDVYRMPPLMVPNVAKVRRVKRVTTRRLRHRW